VLSSATQRLQQAQIVNGFVNSLLAIDSSAKVVVLGDLNDFEFSAPLTTLKGSVLTALVETLPQAERYSYVYEGNSQAIDHILVSNNLVSGATYDIVHVNSEFATQVSDHDPALVRLTINNAVAAPTLSSFSPASGPVGTAVTITGTNFTGATTVKFNNVTATFTVNSATSITATVPTGATTGTVSVTTAGGTAISSTSFTITTSTGPVNNNLSNATTISGATATVTGSNVNATKETGEPNHAGNAGGKSVWWNWTAPNANSVTIETTGSPFDTLLGVYTGTVVSALTTIASNDDATTAVTTSKVTFTPVAGTTYRIAVDGYNGALGNITLKVTQTATAATPTISSFSPSSGPVGTSVTITGTNFTGATAVKFNGVSATTFGVTSTSITVTVPTGATSGAISVTTPGGTATSSGTFTVTTTGSSQLLLNPGFENGTTIAPWVSTTGVIDNSASPAAHSGSWKAYLNGYGTTHTDTLYQTVTIPSTATTVTLDFYLLINSAETTTTTAYDTLKVQVRNGGGTVLTTLATYSNLNTSTGYVQKTFNLAAYKGQTVQIYFEGKEDSSQQTSFLIDDTSLTVQ
jgi:hypothetical protein